jgi:hypothetical protein
MEGMILVMAIGLRRLPSREVGNAPCMTIGSSILLIAVGAILRYAVTASVSGISITTIGLILMIAGIAGVVLSLLYVLAFSSRRGVPAERVVERDSYREPPVY